MRQAQLVRTALWAGQRRAANNGRNLYRLKSIPSRTDTPLGAPPQQPPARSDIHRPPKVMAHDCAVGPCCVIESHLALCSGSLLPVVSSDGSVRAWWLLHLRADPERTRI